MHVLDFLSGLRNQPADDLLTFEYRLLCSGEVFRGGVLTADWRKSTVTRLLLSSPFKLFICSQPFNEYPQEIALTFRASYCHESDLEIAQDISSLLSLLCRRLITVAAKVRETHPPNQYEDEIFWDCPIGFINSMKMAFWKRSPALIVHGHKGVEDIIDYNPPPAEIDPDELKIVFTTLPRLAHAESFISSVRLYALALQHIKDDVDSAYQLLIASVEAIANDVCKSYLPDESERLKTKESVAILAKKFGLPEDKAHALALEACKGIGWNNRKFIKFIFDHTDDSLWSEDTLFRSSDLSHFMPKKENFKKALSQIYKARGKTTHQGHSYPVSANINGGPTIPAKAVVDAINMALGKVRDQDVFPPIIWFERVVNQALRGFLCHALKSSP